MEYEVAPEPTDEERRALEAALAADGDASPGYASAWRRAALELDEDD